MARAFLLAQLLLASSLFFALSSHGEELAEAVASDAVSPVHSPAAAPSHHHPGHHPHHHPPASVPALSPTAAHAPAPHHHHHHHTHAPVPAPMAHPPSHAPSHAPAHAPAHVPVHPPVHPPVAPMGRRFIAVQGVVYCKSCKYSGAETLLGATPVLGAVVKLECNNTKYRPTVQTAKTDKNGYFFLKAPKTITTYAFHKCMASLASSPVPSCQKPSALHGGTVGAVLRPEKPVMIDKLPYTVFTVGPFAFEPQCKH
ncbi:hypothetical protein ACJRO7_017311 [Eucalyptus globulus]|uniref:Uncharacterized protein n=1 Tax=Eucalyptus globulus TaxID=34317 RepID=A0ABD3KUA0_EUCGL